MNTRTMDKRTNKHLYRRKLHELPLRINIPYLLTITIRVCVLQHDNGKIMTIFIRYKQLNETSRLLLYQKSCFETSDKWWANANLYLPYLPARHNRGALARARDRQLLTTLEINSAEHIRESTEIHERQGRTYVYKRGGLIPLLLL
jgi:hypothetical protein